MAVEDYYQRYSDRGYIFSDEILTRYALSLATKPFVILSGISGTGKTKIAQLFEVPPRSPQMGAVIRQVVSGQPSPDDYILLTITDGLVNGDGRANIRFNQLAAVLEPNELTALDEQIEEKKQANDNGNICEPIQLIVEAPEGEELFLSLYLQRASSPLARLRAKSKRGDAYEYDNRVYFRNNFNIDDVLKLQKTGIHRLKIVEVNNQIIIEERQAEIEDEIKKIDNKCFISVKSNWTDSSELLGYYNPLTNKYSITKFLRFLLLAKDNPTLPFFAILDEMNLSKVEHYFSDFLSCIESRVVNPDGSIEQEGITLFSGAEFVLTDDDIYDEIQSIVKIPLNLYVTGTVNIDDTTYMFSPKVLDRANVIEFNEVFIGEDVPQSGLRLKEFPSFYSLNKSEISMFQELRTDTKKHIESILEILKKYNMHFGYRTISEISHFIKNSKIYIEDSDQLEIAALDIQILQKVLPKFYGSYAKLNNILKELILYLSDKQGSIDEFDLNQINSIEVGALPFNRSLAKLIKMYETLTTQGFASFIE